VHAAEWKRAAAWSDATPQAYLYTSLPASLIAQFGPQGAGGAGPLSQYPNLGRRADAVGPRHEALWAQAVRENPDPER
jgi:hypothetical protein